MALGPSTQVINGTRFDLSSREAWFPRGWGPQTAGVPQISPTMPPFLGGSPYASSSIYATASGMGTAENNNAATQIAAAHPFNWKVSPLLWAVIGLVVALLLIQKIHWRKTILAGEERVGVGRESEEARVAA